MNKEIIKAMQGKKEHKARKWWHKNSYKILRVILFPVWIGNILLEKIRAWLNSRQKWSEERAAEILNYYIPRRADWDEKEQCFCFFNNGMGWNLALAKKYLKHKDRRFWKVNCNWYGSKMREYLIEKYQLEGFTKKVIACGDYNWTEVIFYLNK